MQKFAYGFLKLKPNEFWDLIPQEYRLMQEGFEQQREYDFGLHVQSLRVLRHIGYTVYATAPKKKGQSNISIEKYLTLPNDNAKSTDSLPATKEDFEKIKELHNKKFNN